MKKKRNFLLTLLVVMLCVTVCFTAFACTPSDDNDTGETEELMLSNGTFAETTGDTFPKTPSSWSAAAGATGTNATPNGDGDIISGVISTDSSVYNKNANRWGIKDVGNPFSPVSDAKDSNILMINNVASSAYKYTSGSTSLEKNKYYEISLWIRTYGDNAYAFVYVNGDAYAEFKNIQTNNVWKEFKIYVEASAISNKSVSVVISNGDGDKVNGTMSQGVVFADEVRAKEIEKEDYVNAVQSDSVYKYTMKTPDSEFNYVSGSTNPFSPSKFNTVSGSSEEGGSNAPSGSSYVTRGVVDLDKAYDDLGFSGNDLKLADSVGSKMLFIKNKQATAVGYRSSVQMRFEANKNYKLSVWVRTEDISFGKGAQLKLTKGSSDSNTTKHEIVDIDTQGQWAKYTFNIMSNQLSDNDFYLEFWLGQGGEKDYDTHVQGTAFFDRIVLEEVSPDAFEATNSKTVDLTQDLEISKNLIDDGFLGSANWQEIAQSDAYDLDNSNGIADHSQGQLTVLPADNLTAEGADGKVTLNQGITLYNNAPTHYGIVIKNGIDNLGVNHNKYYKLSMWVKTDLDKSYDGKGLNISLMKPAEKEDEDPTALQTINNINTREIEASNGYVEVTFYIAGALIDDEEVYVEVSLGSGTKYTPQTFVQGKAYITLVSMTEIEYSDYSSASTGTYAKKHSFATTSSADSVTNGSFSKVDVSTTLNNYKDSEDGDVFDANGNLLLTGSPEGWTISNTNYLSSLKAGVFSIDNSDQWNYIFGSQGITPEQLLNGLEHNDDESLLVIKTKDTNETTGYLKVPTTPDTCGCPLPHADNNYLCDGSCGEDCLHNKFNGITKPVGYSSSSISFTKNKYYQVNVWVNSDIMASVTLYTSQQSRTIKVPSTNGVWQKVTFFVETGLSTVSAKLQLYMGDKSVDSNEPMNGTVLFDQATFYELSKEDFDKANAAAPTDYNQTVSYITDSFTIEEQNTDELSSPTDWTGAAAESDAKADDEHLNKGIFDKKNSSWDWLYVTDEDGTQHKLPEDVVNTLITTADDYFLVINNRKDTAYNYTTKVSKDMAADSYYRVSVNVYTYGLKKDQHAYISLKMNNKTYTFGADSESGVLVNTSTYGEDGTETAGSGWKTYTFYIHTEESVSISNVNITLGLGEKGKDDNYVQGYAFFDDVTFETIDEDEFPAEDGYNKAEVNRIVFTKADAEAPAPEEEENKNDPGANSLLWLYISSAVIGLILIIAVVVVIYNKNKDKIKRFFAKKGSKGKDPEYSRNKGGSNPAPSQETKKRTKDEFSDKK